MAQALLRNSFLAAIVAVASATMMPVDSVADTGTKLISIEQPSWNALADGGGDQARVCPDPAAAADHGSERARKPKFSPIRTVAGSQPIAVTIAAVGDVLLHSQLQRQGFDDFAGFRSLWRKMEPILSGPDIAIANLEGPVAEDIQPNRQRAKQPVRHYDNHVYTGYPMFNYPPAALHALTAAGIDLVSIANNHSYDRGQIGFEATIDALQRNGLAFAGGRSETAAAETPLWGAVSARDGSKVAFVACSYGFNVPPPSGRQAPLCFDDRAALLQTIANLSCRSDLAGVVFLPHWGQEYRVQPTLKQRELAYQALEAGAMAVIGAHPHVVQPIEPYRTADGRDTIVAFSLGNFASAQKEEPRRTAIVLYLDLIATDNGKLTVGAVRYLPIETQHRREAGRTRFDIKPIADPEAAAVRYAELVKGGTQLIHDPGGLPGGTALHMPPHPRLNDADDSQIAWLGQQAKAAALDAQRAGAMTGALVEASSKAVAISEQQRQAKREQAAIQARLHYLQLEQEHTERKIASLRNGLGEPAGTTADSSFKPAISNARSQTETSFTPPGRLVVNADRLFAPNTARIRDDAADLLKTIADTVKSWEQQSTFRSIEWWLEVQGHADERPLKSGTYRSNRHLSAERALSVVEALIAAGVDGSRLYASGLGATAPIATENTDDAHAQNRRVELIMRRR